MKYASPKNLTFRFRNCSSSWIS